MSRLMHAVLEDLKDARVDHAVVDQVRESLERNIPDRVYTASVWLLGIATISLTVGAIVLLALGRQTPDALWAALGAGLGGLAGVFAGKNSG